MLATALEFAPGTAEDNKKVLIGLYDPKFLLSSYRQACVEHKSRDVVLMNLDPENPSELLAGKRTPQMGLESAHKIMQLPIDSDAFWIIVKLPQVAMPVTAVLYALPYEQAAEGEALQLDS